MVSTQSTIPVRITGPDVSNKTRSRARGEFRRKGYTEEVSFFRILSDEWAVEERVVEERQGWRPKSEGFLWGVNVDFESGEHFIVVVEKGCGVEVG